MIVRSASRTSSLAPGAAWHELAPATQRRALHAFCRTQGAAFKSRHGNIASLGVAFRTPTTNDAGGVCLGVLVNNVDCRHARPVPPMLTFHVRDGSTLRTVAVPTDVQPLGNGQPQSNDNLAAGILAVAPENAHDYVRGAACCIAHEIGNAAQRYVVSCHHVLALSSLNGRNCVAADAIVFSARNRVIARHVDHAPMAANTIGALDVAIAALAPDADVVWNYNGLLQTRVARGIHLPSNCSIYTPTGSVAARFVGEYTDVPLYYPQCGTVIIKAAYRFLAATISGDSGSAVMAADGTLHGMHFWGDPAQGIAYAIPAYALFRPGLFSKNVELA